MTSPATNPVVAGITEAASNAARLGIKGLESLRPATVFAGSTGAGNACQVIMDNDSSPVPAFTLVGAVLAGDRVQTIKVEPEGIYVIGWYSGAYGGTLSDGSFNAATDGNTTSSSSYSTLNSGGNPARIAGFVKTRGSTRLAVTLGSTCISTVANTLVQYAVLISGTDYAIASLGINPANTHLFAGGVRHLTGIAAGTYDIDARWRRPAGPGILAQDGNDLLSFRVEEVI